MRPKKRAVVAVIYENGRFLAITRSATVGAPNKACFPGGTIEAGETMERALIREMEEELSIVVEPIRQLWQSVARSGTELNWWEARMPGKQKITASPDEVAAVAWLTQGQMMALPNLLETNAEFFVARNHNLFQIDESL